MKKTREVGLEFSEENEKAFYRIYGRIIATEPNKVSGDCPSTMCFADADFAGCSVSLRSTSGSIMYHRGMPIVWSSKKQTLRALSTCESEYVALFDTIRMSKMSGFLDFFLESGKIPLTFTDNMSALSLSKSSLVSKRSKHIDLRYHEIRDHAKDLAYVPTSRNLADPLTKGLVSEKYISLFRHTEDGDDAGRPGDVECLEATVMSCYASAIFN